MEHVYVFNYCTSSIYHFTVKNDEDIEESIQTIITKLGKINCKLR